MIQYEPYFEMYKYSVVPVDRFVKIVKKVYHRVDLHKIVEVKGKLEGTECMKR
jgi:hypothetical protein